MMMMLEETAKAPTTPSKLKDASRTSRYRKRKNAALPTTSGTALAPESAGCGVVAPSSSSESSELLRLEEVAEAVDDEVGQDASGPGDQDDVRVLREGRRDEQQGTERDDNRELVQFSDLGKEPLDRASQLICRSSKTKSRKIMKQEDAAEGRDGRVGVLQCVLVLVGMVKWRAGTPRWG